MQETQEQTSMALDRMKRVVKGGSHNAGPERTGVEEAQPGEKPSTSPSEPGDQAGIVDAANGVQPVPEAGSSAGAPSPGVLFGVGRFRLGIHCS